MKCNIPFIHLSLFSAGLMALLVSCTNPDNRAKASTEEHTRVEALLEENSRLHKALLLAKREEEQAKVTAEECKNELKFIEKNQRHHVHKFVHSAQRPLPLKFF